jgi:PTH1 family peptidyl-tRNA hydrolase
MADSGLKAIVGLGNPGPEHARQRHNAGFWLVERLAELYRCPLRVESKFLGEVARTRIGGAEVLLLKPATYMNRSGESIQRLAQFYKLAPGDILVAHDELDLPVGAARFKLGGGHGGHNGLRSVHQHLGADYRRLRLGIAHPGHKDLVLDYVLGRPSAAEEALIRAAIEAAAQAIPVWLEQSWDKALHRLHGSGAAPATNSQPSSSAPPAKAQNQPE